MLSCKRQFSPEIALMPRKQKASKGVQNATQEHPRNEVVIPGWPQFMRHRRAIHSDAHEPTERTRAVVETMTSYGASQPQIASALDIGVDTLARYYREEITLGAQRANMAVSLNLFRIATSPEISNAVVSAAIWWTKARMGWSEIRRTMSDVRSTTLSANVRDMTDEQLLSIISSSGVGAGLEGDLPSPGKPGEFG